MSGRSRFYDLYVDDQQGSGQRIRRCKYFDRGSCRAGDNCRFDHVYSSGGGPPEATAYDGDSSEAVGYEEAKRWSKPSSPTLSVCSFISTQARKNDLGKYTEKVWEFNENIDKLTGRHRSDIEKEKENVVDHIIEIQMWNKVWNRVKHLALNNDDRMNTKQQWKQVRTD
jgi:hypothetical protein